ncbi:MAG: zf-HC2 domain-containing protein [Bacteroidales bacterium]|nr:zf-HC2 domain-containing protein [Bacteroidales bacterium]
MNKKQHIIFSKGECPPTEAFYSYLEGKLSAEEIRKFELHLADCEMCSDMLEGIELVGSRAMAETQINKINTKIRKNSQNRESKIIRIDRRMRYLAAAVVIVLAASYFVLDNNIRNKEQKLVSKNEESAKNQEIAQELTKTEEEKNEDSMKNNNQTFSEKAPLGGADIIKKTGESEKKNIAETSRTLVDYDAVDAISDTKVLIENETELKEQEEREISGARGGNVSANVKSEDMETPVYTIVVADEQQKDVPKTAIEESDDGFTAGLFAKREDRGSKRKESAKKPGSNTRNVRLSGGEQADKNEVELESGKGDYEPLDQKALQEEKNNLGNISQEVEPFNLALSYLSNGETSKAEEIFMKIAENKENPYCIKAKWHLANIYIDAGENQKAEKLLMEIIENKGQLKTEAEELLESL